MNFDIDAITQSILNPTSAGQQPIRSNIIPGGSGGSAWNWGIDSAAQVSPNNFVFNAIVIFLWIIGIVTVLTFIYAGVRYITAGGDMEKAESGKRMLTGSIIGMIIILASFIVFSFTVNVLNNPDRAANPAGVQQLLDQPAGINGVGTGTATDIDGDGQPNASDNDIDGDGQLNTVDTDDDGDRIDDNSDSTPSGP